MQGRADNEKELSAPPAIRATMLRRVFKAFHYRDFRLMWIGACTSSIGTWMQTVAQGWLIYKISHSAFLLALDPFLGNIPIFLFSLVGGVVADRIERRRVLIGSQWVQMSCALLLTFLVGFHVVRVWHILACSFVAGLAQAFGGPAYQALIPTLVDKEDMPNAIALNSIQFNVAVTVGPALGGAALARLGDTWCFGLNALSFVAPIISLSLLRVRFLPVPTTESILTSMKQGIRFIRRQGAMEALIVLAFCMTFLAVPMRTFLPVFAKDIFHRGAETYAMFLSLSGLGSIVGALTVAGIGNVRNKGRVALTMLICLGAAISGFAVSGSLAMSCVMLFLSGGAMIGVFAMVSSLVQLIVTNEMRGRVMSVYNFAFRGGMPMGNLLTGWLVPMFTAPVVLAVNGLLLIALALYFLLGQRRVAEL
jgi:predicted MFS family arabinose efflux permease